MSMVYEPRRGDLYIAELEPPFGQRPCIVISNDTGNHFSDNVIVIPITSRKKKQLPTHVWITSKTGLRIPGTALCEHILTIPKFNLVKFIGTIHGHKEEKRLNEAIKVSIDLM